MTNQTDDCTEAQVRCSRCGRTRAEIGTIWPFWSTVGFEHPHKVYCDECTESVLTARSMVEERPA